MIYNVKDFVGNKVFTRGVIESFAIAQKNGIKFNIPRIQRGLSSKYEFKKIILESIFEDIRTLYFKKKCLYNLQVVTISSDFNAVVSQENSDIIDGFQRLGTLSLFGLLNYREAVLAGNEFVVERLTQALFGGNPNTFNPASSFILQIDNREHSEYLSKTLRAFFAVLIEEFNAEGFASFSGFNPKNAKNFSEIFKEKLGENEDLKENPYAFILYEIAKGIESGNFSYYFKEATAYKFGAENEEYKVEEEMFNYLQMIEFTFSIPPSKIERASIFERLNTPATLLEQYTIVRNTALSYIEDTFKNQETIEAAENLLDEVDRNINKLTTSDAKKNKLKLQFVEIALHCRQKSGECMTSSPGKVINTVSSFFKKEIEKKSFDFFDFFKEVNDLIKTELILQKKESHVNAKVVRDIAFFLKNTSKMRKRFSIALLPLANFLLASKVKYSHKEVKKIINLFFLYRLLRSKPIEGKNVEKGSEEMFSEISQIIYKNKEGEYEKIKKLLLSRIPKENIETFIVRLNSWKFSFQEKMDKEVANLLNWVMLSYHDEIAFEEADILTYELDHTIPEGLVKNNRSIKTTGFSAELNDLIVDKYYTKWHSYAFISKKVNGRISDHILPARVGVYKELPFKTLRTLFGEQLPSKLKTKNDLFEVIENHEKYVNKLLEEAIFSEIC